MKKAVLILSLFPILLFAEALNVDAVFRLYNLNTIKEGSTSSDATALSFGAVAGLETKKWHGTYSRVNFMTTNALFLMPDTSRIDTSVLGRNRAVISGNPDDARQSFSVLGEAYAGYKKHNFDIKLGRQIIHSPLADAKVIRVLPTTFNASYLKYHTKTYTLGYARIDQIKQRTSDQFYNILSHALGTNTLAYTGQTDGTMQMIEGHYQFNDTLQVLSYHYIIPNFIQSNYSQLSFEPSALFFKLQTLWQQSIGTFDTNLKNGSTVLGALSAGVKVFSSGIKLGYRTDTNNLCFATTYTAFNSNAHSSIIAPFDGTPLFTDTLTGNNLFDSNYGKALNADSAYRAGTFAFKASYSKQFKKIKTTFATARFDTGALASQTDLNLVFAFKSNQWDIALKGVWVFDNNQVAGDRLYQYGIIANRPF